MPHIVVDIPETRGGSSLDGAIARQFADIQRQLMGLMKSHQDSATTMRGELLEALQQQRDSFLSMVERLMRMMERSPSAPHDTLANALQGLKQVMADLPKDLQGALAHQAKASTPRPQVTIRMDAVAKRLDGLEGAMRQQMDHSLFKQPLGAPRKGIRLRTFGSNY